MPAARDFGLVRLSSGDSAAGRSSLDAGFDGMFDSKSKLDNVGWDGNYGLTVTTASEGPLALKFALEHTSGHVGDEWQASTGRERIGYTRHEIAVGAARRVRRMRVYGELGYAFHMLNDELQRPWRVQTGLEREWPQSWADKRLGWYAAADFQLFEERSWRVDYALEGGVLAYGRAPLPHRSALGRRPPAHLGVLPGHRALAHARILGGLLTDVG